MLTRPGRAALVLATAVAALAGAASQVAAPPAAPGAVPAWFLPLAAAASRRFAVPAPLLTAVAQVESGFDPQAVGPPVPGGPALGLMQFLPSSWALFDVVPGATPFDPGPAVLAAAHHLRVSGTRADGRWDAAAALFGYNHSQSYVATVLALAARFGYVYAGPLPSGGAG